MKISIYFFQKKTMIKFRVKMWLFVTWYVLLQILQNHATILNPEFLSSYPFKDEYKKSLTDTVSLKY